MNKNELRQIILEHGDVVVTYRSRNSKKLKYNVVTLNFNTKYIRTKRTFAKEDGSNLLCFAWDTDSYRLITCSQVMSAVPLAAVLRNRID